MDDLIENVFPDTVVQVQQYRSFVNQAERVQISSQQDMNDYDPTTLTSYYNFRVRLPRPVLDVKSIQLARASIPTPVASLPDTECTFWYYALPQATRGAIFDNNAGVPAPTATYTFNPSGTIFEVSSNTVYPDSNLNFDLGVILLNGVVYVYDVATAYNNGNGGVPTEVYNDTNVLTFWITYTPNFELPPRDLKYLHYIRLLPSTVQPDLLINGGDPDQTVFGFNKQFPDYDSLVVELNSACSNDPLEATPMNDNPFSFTWVENQIRFKLSTRYNRILFEGMDDHLTYLPVASDDPLWLFACDNPIDGLVQRDRENLQNPIAFFPPGAIAVIQPYIPFRNLNLRLGFNYAIYPEGVNYLSMLRPYPNTDLDDDFDHLAPGYADMVNTSCVHLYTDITGGSTVDSIAEKALLGTIPLNTSPLQVAFHSLPLSNPLTKISNQLYEIYIEMRTDAGQPFYIGNNSIVSLEFILTY